MERIILDQINIGRRSLDALSVFLDNQSRVIVLPMLWHTHLSSIGTVLRFRLEASRMDKRNYESLNIEKQIWALNEAPVSDQTIKAYSWKVFRFFEYINELSLNSEDELISVHNSELVTSTFLDHYLNEILPSMVDSVASLELHRSALMAYFDFLTYMEITPRISSSIYRKTRNLVSSNDHRPIKIKYISRDQRSDLVMACNCKRDRLILRMGYEVGLRTEECTGLRLGKTLAKGQIFKGINDLISELDESLDQLQFMYMLSGRYTKRGRSRYIYFDRNLLVSIKDYRDSERESLLRGGSKTDTLFLRADPAGKGKPIAAHQASKVYSKVKTKIPFLNQQSSYHDLRHTFATELYHQEQYDENGYETRSESTALIKVQQRLGHSSNASTRLYLHLRQQLIEVEGESNAPR